jgi:hypothetical protein
MLRLQEQRVLSGVLDQSGSVEALDFPGISAVRGG